MKRLEQRFAAAGLDQDVCEHLRWLQALAVNIGRDIVWGREKDPIRTVRGAGYALGERAFR